MGQYTDEVVDYRQAAQEPLQGVPRYCQDQGWREEGQEIDGCWDAYAGNGCGYDSSCCLHDLVQRKHWLGVQDAEGLGTPRAMKDSIPTDLLLLICAISFCYLGDFVDRSIRDSTIVNYLVGPQSFSGPMDVLCRRSLSVGTDFLILLQLSLGPQHTRCKCFAHHLCLLIAEGATPS